MKKFLLALILTLPLLAFAQTTPKVVSRGPVYQVSGNPNLIPGFQSQLGVFATPLVKDLLTGNWWEFDKDAPFGSRWKIFSPGTIQGVIDRQRGSDDFMDIYYYNTIHTVANDYYAVAGSGVMNFSALKFLRLSSGDSLWLESNIQLDINSPDVAINGVEHPQNTPAGEGLPPGTYVQVVNEAGELGGSNGWLSIFDTGGAGSNVLFVSQATGNNITGNGSIQRPYADPWFAVDSTDAGGTVFVLDGNYKIDTIGGSYGNVFFPVYGFTSANLAKKDVNIVNGPGVKYEWNHAYRLPIVYDTIGVKFTFKGGTVKQELTANESLVRVGKYGKYAPSSLHFEPDSLIIGNNDYNSPIVFGNIDKIFIGGKYLKSFRAMVTRGYSTDTLKTEANIVFDEGYLIATDETFSAPKMVGSKFNIRFKKLYVEEDFYVTNFRHGVNAEVSINISNFYLKRWSTVSNQMFLLWAARSGAEPMINSTLRFHADNAVLDSLILCDGTANRFASNTGNKVIITGNYTALKRGFFSNSSDKAAGQDNVTYYLNNCHVQSTISPPLLISQGSRVYVNNSSFSSVTDTSFVRLSTTARITVNNSSFTQLGTKPFCESITGVGSITLNNSSYNSSAPTSALVNSNNPSWKRVRFTATPGQSTYTDSSTKLPVDTANLIVLKNGLEIDDTIDYTYVPATGVITFTPALVGGEIITLRWYD